MERALERVVLHLDMDAFYASIEVRDRPELAGKPVIVGHRGRRGVVSTCSYEARGFGVRSAMPSAVAARRCPDAVWVSGDMRRYVRESRRVRAILADHCPVVEPLSIDEAFCDLTGLARDLEAGAAIGETMRARIRAELRLTASVGVAPNKFLAKLSSDLDKPDGLFVLPIERVPEVLWPLPVGRLPGVGPKTAEKLAAHGFERIGRLLAVPEARLARVVGDHGAARLHRLARGIDERPVRAGRAAKSISEERTYGTDLTDAAEIDRALLARSEGVARQLRGQNLRAKTVHIKVRTGDYRTWTRAETLPSPTDLTETLVAAARRLFRERIDLGTDGVRLLGVGVSGLEGDREDQGSLFPDADELRARKRAVATDAVRRRIGESAVTRARLLRRTNRDSGSRPDDDADRSERDGLALPSVD